MKDGIARKDSGVLEREAHSLKSAVRNFGANDAYEAASHLERSWKEREMEMAGEGLSKLKNTIAKLVPEIKTVLQEMIK